MFRKLLCVSRLYCDPDSSADHIFLMCLPRAPCVYVTWCDWFRGLKSWVHNNNTKNMITGGSRKRGGGGRWGGGGVRWNEKHICINVIKWNTSCCSCVFALFLEVCSVLFSIILIKTNKQTNKQKSRRQSFVICVSLEMYFSICNNKMTTEQA